MSKVNSVSNAKKLAFTGFFSALIFVFTAYLHIPTGAGYTHAGDGIIYLAACILPTPYAVASGIIGGVLADGLSGYAVWIPATAIIKGLTALCFSNKGTKIISLRNILGIIPSMIICIAGYSFYEGIAMAGGYSAAALIAAFTQTPSYIIQIAASAVLYIASGMALDKIDFKKKIT